MSAHSTLVFSDLQTGGHNESIPEGCTRIRFSEWEYLPWDNPDNIVEQGVSLHTAQVRTNMMQLFFLIGGPANLINMVVFFKQGLKDRVNLLLFFLSIADEISVLAYAVHYFEDFYLQFGVEDTGPFFSNLAHYLFTAFHGFCFVSFVLSAIIACERCCCVLWPLRYQTLMRTGTLAVIIVAVYVIVAGLHFVVVVKYYMACVYESDTGVLFNTYGHHEFYLQHREFIDNLDNIFYGAGLPTCTMVVVVAATVITVWKLRQAVAWRTETSSSVSAKEVALTKMLVGTSVLLIVSLCSNCVLRVACLFLPELNTGRRYENLFLTGIWISQMFGFVNSSFNIFIYYMMGTRYRETFWALFGRKTRATQK